MPDELSTMRHRVCRAFDRVESYDKALDRQQKFLRHVVACLDQIAADGPKVYELTKPERNRIWKAKNTVNALAVRVEAKQDKRAVHSIAAKRAPHPSELRRVADRKRG